MTPQLWFCPCAAYGAAAEYVRAVGGAIHLGCGPLGPVPESADVCEQRERAGR